MINHGRVLLANQLPANGDFTAYIAEEYTSADFVPIETTDEIQRIRAVLFGSNPDRDFTNYRCRQLLTILHSTPWAEYLEELDSRITYRVIDTKLVPNTQFAINATQVAGGGPTPLPIFGHPFPPDVIGRSRMQYNVSVMTSSMVRVTRTTTPVSVQTYPFAMTDGLSDLISLQGSGFNFRLTSNATDLMWIVDILNRPQWDVSSLIVDIAAQNAQDVDVLLRGGEPYQTFRNLWRQTELPGQVAGLILGLIYRSNELWRATRASS